VQLRRCFKVIIFPECLRMVDDLIIDADDEAAHQLEAENQALRTERNMLRERVSSREAGAGASKLPLATPDAEEAVRAPKARLLPFSGNPMTLRVPQIGKVPMIIIGVILGAAIGIGVNLAGADPTAVVWLGIIGQIYLRCITLLIAPLVFFSVAMGITSLSELGVNTGKIAARTAGLYVLTTVVAVVEGLTITYILSPAWPQSPAEVKVSARPHQLVFGVEPLRASLINANYPEGQPSMYYNDSVVSHVGLLFKDAPAPVNTSSLMFLYERGVSFELAPQHARGPDGPYTDVGSPLLCHQGAAPLGAIDAHLFRDAANGGALHLLWKDDANARGSSTSRS